MLHRSLKRTHPAYPISPGTIRVNDDEGGTFTLIHCVAGRELRLLNEAYADRAIAELRARFLYRLMHSQLRPSRFGGTRSHRHTRVVD